ncbi:hypothetical protein JTB14_015522 [Gonioctena quinquepunctata]|nr:hypothetical protein JTB14_015522 [Gonioctena quinquepunctata]
MLRSNKLSVKSYLTSFIQMNLLSCSRESAKPNKTPDKYLTTSVSLKPHKGGIERKDDFGVDPKASFLNHNKQSKIPPSSSVGNTISKED